MPILIVAVVLLTILGLLNLQLTFGIVRRLREQGEKQLTGPGGHPDVSELIPGETPGAFDAVSVTGIRLSNATGVRVAAFFSTQCSVCSVRVEPFADYLSMHGIGRDRVLAVVVADGGSDDSSGTRYADRLTRVATVCTEGSDDAISRAFKIIGFPAFCLLDEDGLLIASGYDPAMLPVPASVA